MEHPVSTNSTIGQSPTWNVVIPVKRLNRAKSRLGVATGDQPASTTRGQLAEAFAQDVIQAARDCPQVDCVFVVTDEPGVSRLTQRLGEFWIPEPSGAPPEAERLRLNFVIRHAVTYIEQLVHDPAQSHPDADRPSEPSLAVITADLPCLTPETLTEVFNLAAAHERSFVADHTGKGTSILMVTDPARTRLDPMFGPDSATAHQNSGAVNLGWQAPLASRLDVDTSTDLVRAQELGVGVNTTMVLEGS